MYAAVHVFDVGDEYFQLDPDFTKVVSDAASNSARETASAPQCKALRAEDATITSEIEQIKEICSKLNRVGMFKTSQPNLPDASPLEGPNKLQPASQRIIIPTLFLASETCQLSSLTTDDVNEQNFRALGNSLSGLFHSLDGLNRISRGAGSRAIFFPMVTAFFIAYMFGGGCRVWRAWWLNNEAGQQEMDKLKDQIESFYRQPVNSTEFERWLSSPLSILNNVAPKEAVRYEGLKARLYAKIESRQIDFGNIVTSHGG